MSPATRVRPDSTAPSRRRRLRKFLFVVALVPSILLLLLSARIVLLLLHEQKALQAYEDGDFEVAGKYFAYNQVLNPIEPWLAPFGEGDALYRLDELEPAVAAFERSLRVVPEEHECLVRVNLALTHEAIGDAAIEEGNAQEGREAYLDGLVALGECVELARAEAEVDPRLAEELRRDRRKDAERRKQSDREDERRGEKGDEGSEDGGAEDSQDDESDDDSETDSETDRERAAERWQAAAVSVDRRLARKVGDNPPPATREREQAPPEDEATRERRRQLQERNRQAQEDRVRHQDEFDGDAPPPEEDDSDVPQW